MDHKKLKFLPLLALLLAVLMVGITVMCVFLPNDSTAGEAPVLGNPSEPKIPLTHFGDSSDYVHTNDNFRENAEGTVVKAEGSNDANAYFVNQNKQPIVADRYVLRSSVKVDSYAKVDSVRRAGLLAAYVNKDEFLLFFADYSTSGTSTIVQFGIDGARNGGTEVGGWKFESVPGPSNDFSFDRKFEMKVVKDTDKMYFFVDGVLLYVKVKSYGPTQAGLHNRLTDVTYTDYEMTTDATVVEAELSVAKRMASVVESESFRRHAYIDYGYADAIRYDESRAGYRLPVTMAWRDAYYYANGVTPIGGNTYLWSFDFEPTFEQEKSEIVFQAVEGSRLMIKWVFNQAADGKLTVKTVLHANSGSGVTKTLETDEPLERNCRISFINYNSVYLLVIDGEVVDIQEFGIMTISQIGVGASNGAGVLLLNNVGSIDATVVKDAFYDAMQQAMHSDRFTLGRNSEDATEGNTFAFRKNEDGFLRRSNDTYAEGYLFENGASVKSTSMRVEGNFHIEEPTEGTAASFLVSGSDRGVKFEIVYKNGAWAGRYSLKSKDGYGEAVAFDVGILDFSAVHNFAVIRNADDVLFTVSDRLLQKVTVSGLRSAQAGFGGNGGTIVLGSLFVGRDSVLVNRAKGKAEYVDGVNRFGQNVYTNTGSASAVTDNRDGSFSMAGGNYKEAYYYQNGEPAGGVNYAFSCDITMIGLVNTGQIPLLITSSKYMVRYVFERWDSQYQVFTDVDLDNWARAVGWGETGGNRISVRVEVRETSIQFYFNGNLMHTYLDFPIGPSQIGFGCEINEAKIENLKFERL